MDDTPSPSLSLARSFVDGISRYYALPLTQIWFDTLIHVTKLIYNGFPHTAQDHRETFSGVHFTKHVRYGPLRSETYQIMEPVADVHEGGRPAPIRGCVIYVHGGGFCATEAEFYNGSVAYLVRNGFIVFCLDYPLAPQHPHPRPLLSILAATRHAQRYVQERGLHADLDLGYTLAGDSAGANLVMQAAAVLHNSKLLATLRQACGSEGDAEALRPELHPCIARVVSIYGMMGNEVEVEVADGGAAAPPSGVASCIAAEVIHLLWRMHAGRTPEACPLPAKFSEWLSRCPEMRMPPVLLCCGGSDVVRLSSKHIDKEMTNLQLKHRMIWYPGHHAFFGLPPNWTFGSCHTNAMPCARDILSFIRHGLDVAASPTLAEFTRGPRKVSLEGSAFIVYSQVLLIPVIIPGIPLVAALRLLSKERARVFKRVALLARRIAQAWLGCAVYDLLRWACRLDDARRIDVR